MLGLQTLNRAYFRLFIPPPMMDVDEWACRYRQLSRLSNVRGGNWRSRCYQREIMKGITDRDVRSIVVVGAAQTVGKTEMHLNAIGRNIHLNPGPMLFVLPTIELAERISKKRVQPMFDVTPVLHELVGDQKSRAANNTVRAKSFPGGVLNIAGANSPSDLASDPQRDFYVDEVDRCEAAAGKEGDVLALGEARQETFGEMAFSLYTSSPSGKRPRTIGETQPVGVSKILVLFGESDKRYWHCPCQKCGHRQFLRWGMVRWTERDYTTAKIHCEKCDYGHNDAERIAMIEAGAWVATAPFNGRRGYFLNGIYSLSNPQRGCPDRLFQMVRDFYRAKNRGPESLRAWVNTFLCECFEDDEDAEQPDGTLLVAKREAYDATVPESVLICTAGVDVQKGNKDKHGRLELQVLGFGENDEPFALAYEVFTGAPEHPATWQQLDDYLLNTTFITADGRELIIERVAIDSGHVPDTVYSFCQPRGARMVKGTMQRVVAIKGYKGVGQPVMSLPRKSGVKRTRLWLIATNTAKLWVYGLIQKVIAGQKVAHWPLDRAPYFDEDYFRSLTSEPTQKKFSAGLEYIDFLKPTMPNEALDTFVYAYGALKMATVPWATLKERKNAPPSLPPPPTPAPDIQQLMKRAHAGGGNNGWMGQFRS